VVVAVTDDTAINHGAAVLNTDEIGTLLVAFSIDMNAGTLDLTFNEPILAHELDPTQIVLHSAATLSQATNLSLQGGSLNRDLDAQGLISQVILQGTDVLAIKALFTLGTSVNSTFISVSTDLVTDLASNENIAVPQSGDELLQANSYVGDTTAPELEAFTLYDPNAGKVELSFNEPVNINTLNITLLQLAEGGSGTDTRYNLTGTRAVEYDDDSFMAISITISSSDLENVQTLTDLGVNTNNTRIVIGEGAINDVSDIPIGVTALSQVQFVGDATLVSLSAFDLDMDLGVINLNFSASVDFSTVVPERFTLRGNRIVNGSSNHPLSEDCVVLTSTNGFSIRVRLTTEDLNSIKADRTLATEADTTLLTFSPDSALDLFGRSVVAVTQLNMAAVTTYTPDTTVPTVSSTALNLNAGTLSISFSETVDLRTIDYTALKIQGRNGEGPIALTGGSIDPTDASTSVTITLTDADLNALKFSEAIATEVSTTRISFDEFISDMSGNNIAAVANLNATEVNSYTADNTAPTAEGFNLQLSAGVLVVTFSESVFTSSLNVSRFIIQDSDGANSYRLTSEDASQVSSLIIAVALNDDDLNALKLATSLATSTSNTYLRADANAFTDTTGIANTAVNAADAVQVTRFVPDGLAPRLIQADLNMNSSMLSLSFSEVINATSFVPGTLSIQNANNLDDSVRHNLSTASVLVNGQENGLIQVIHLAVADQNALKNDAALAVSSSSTFLAMASSAFSDMNGNGVGGIDTANAEAVTFFAPDRISPTLSSFALDMDSRDLVMNFVEPINESSLQISEFGLQSAVNATDLISLTGGSISRSQMASS
jgi:hypothetical protein